MSRGNQSRRSPAESACGRATTVFSLALLVCATSACSELAKTAPAKPTTTVVLSEGEVAAQFELAAPSTPSFVLRGTMPVPKGTHPRADGASPFKVLDSTGAAVSAQVEIVSRYPSDADGADVVEVLARVTRPDSASPGERLTYNVMYQPHPPPAFAGDLDVENLLATPQSVVLATRDVFQNSYSSDLFADVLAEQHASMRTLRQGAYATQIATHDTLRADAPVGGPTATLPHMMGVHSYITRWSGAPFFSLDLRIHNAMSGRDGNDPADNPLGKIYFDALELRLPPGWTVLNALPDPYFGPPHDSNGSRVWPIVAPLADGKLHVMPAMAQFVRRLVVVKDGFEAEALACLHEENLGFVRDAVSGTGQPFLSWWNPATARYFPQRQQMPSLAHLNLESIRGSDHGQLLGRLAQVQNGTSGWWPAESHGLGWAHPWGVTEGGMVSGAEIYLIDGVATAAAGSNDGYRMFQLMHRMYTDRQRNVLFNKDGLHTAWEQWTYPGPTGPILPIWWYNEPMLWASDPFGYNLAPTFQVDAVVQAGLVPGYENDLLAFGSIDEAHLIRYTCSPKVLVWLGNDAIAKDDLRSQAEGFLMAYTPLPQDAYTGVIPTGLLAARRYVDALPGRGLFYGRGEAWGLDVVNAAYSTQDATWRARTRPWFDEVIDVIDDGQANCTGIIQRSQLSNVFNAQYSCRQSIECAITENALVGMRESVYSGESAQFTSKVNAVLRNSFYAMISSLVWSPTHHGPWAMMAVGSINLNYAPFCNTIPADGNYGYADQYQIWSSFAYAYKLTNDPTFLTKAQEALGGMDVLTALSQSGLENLQNNAALLALVQGM